MCAAPFLGDVDRLHRVRVGPRPLPELTGALARAGIDERAAIFVDLSPIRCLATAPRLRTLGFSVVPVIQRWVTSPAVLRCEHLVGALLEYAPPAPWLESSRGVVFILDGDRLGGGQARPELAGVGRPPASPRRFDNRYSYPVCRFPPPAFLRAQGIKSVHWLSAAGIAPDLQLYAQRLAEADLVAQILNVRR